MRGITKKYFSSTQRLHQIKTSPIKVVNGVLGAYSDTPNRTKEYKSMAETHNNYKDIISKLDNENISIIIATHNPNLIRHSKKNLETEMTNLNQLIFDFGLEKNFKDEDFYVSKSNKYAFDLINSWPKWEKNFLNLIGEKYSGKTHLINIFLKRHKGIKLEANALKNENLKEVKLYENVVLENLNQNINEKILYSLYNLIDQDNKYLIITSNIPITNIDLELDDLKSRFRNFITQKIEKPDDNLIFALIVKNLSDRQITLNEKLINYAIKRIDRSYSKIFDFIYKIDEISLKKKKSIDLRIIKEVLGE